MPHVSVKKMLSEFFKGTHPSAIRFGKKKRKKKRGTHPFVDKQRFASCLTVRDGTELKNEGTNPS